MTICLLTLSEFLTQTYHYVSIINTTTKHNYFRILELNGNINDLSQQNKMFYLLLEHFSISSYLDKYKISPCYQFKFVSLSFPFDNYYFTWVKYSHLIWIKWFRPIQNRFKPNEKYTRHKNHTLVLSVVLNVGVTSKS